MNRCTQLYCMYYTLLSGSLSASLSLLKTLWVFALGMLLSGLYRERRYINIEIRYDTIYFAFAWIYLYIYIYNLAIYVALYCWRLSDSSWESGSLFCCRLRFLHLWDFPRAAAAAAAADAAIDYYLNEAPLDTTFDRCRVHHYRGAIEVVRLDWNCSPMFQIVEALE